MRRAGQGFTDDFELVSDGSLSADAVEGRYDNEVSVSVGWILLMGTHCPAFLYHVVVLNVRLQLSTWHLAFWYLCAVVGGEAKA